MPIPIIYDYWFLILLSDTLQNYFQTTVQKLGLRSVTFFNVSYAHKVCFFCINHRNNSNIVKYYLYIYIYIYIYINI